MFIRMICLLLVTLLSISQSVYAQSGQNLPDILPYNSLHLFDSGESYQLADQDGETFRNAVLANTGVSIVEFMLPTCLACNPTQTEIHNLISNYKGKVRYLRLNLNYNLKLSYKYDVPRVPAVLVFNNGHLIKKFSDYGKDQNIQLAHVIQSQLPRPASALAGASQPAHN